MNHYILIDAIGYLDADMLAKHLERKERIKQQIGKQKRTNMMKWSAVAACFCLILALSTFALTQIQDRPGEIVAPTETGSIEGSNGIPTQPDNNLNSGIDSGALLAMNSMYKVGEHSSMVRAEINNVLGMFSLDDFGSSKILLVEFCVIEDYYEKISPGTVVTVPISMDGKEINDKSMLAELQTFLDDADEFVLYINRLYNTRIIYDEAGIKVDKENVASLNLMVFHYIIPLKNEKVDTSAVYELLDKYEVDYYPPQEIIGYSSFVVDGMSIETLEKNIKSLYQWHLLEQQNSTESLPEDKGYDY